MATIQIDANELKHALKDALTEVLDEKREVFHDVFAEVLEDFCMAEAIEEGRGTKTEKREEVFKMLKGE